jgi:hypothetical protein
VRHQSGKEPANDISSPAAMIANQRSAATYPAAARCLDAAALVAMGAEMARRRGLL